MKWLDYRDRLGIGIRDIDKLEALKNRLLNFLDRGEYDASFTERMLYSFFMTIGKRFEDDFGYELEAIEDIISDACSIQDLISKYIAFYNSKVLYSPGENDENILNALKESMEYLRIPFDIEFDRDGVFLFPKGAQELDDVLVSEPLEWLTSYPTAHSAFVKALKDYTDATELTASETADKFRKSLEAFMQEFFGGGKSLENYKSEYGSYLKSNGIPAELAQNFVTLLDSYAKYNNNYAKHHDKTSKKALEYIMYQTGNIIRLLITLKQEE